MENYTPVYAFILRKKELEDTTIVCGTKEMFSEWCTFSNIEEVTIPSLPAYYRGAKWPTSLFMGENGEAFQVIYVDLSKYLE